VGMAHLAKLLKYSEEKLEKLKQIENITVQQKTAIDSRDFAALNSLVEEKQKIIDYIDWCDSAFQEELKKVKERLGVKTFEEIGEVNGRDEKKALAGIIGLIIEAIEKIQTLEKDNHQKLLASMEQVREKLKKVRNGQKSIAVYDSGIGIASGSFVDKKK
ncbi:MAG: flagellar protein FlgN, partial [Clostridiales bacterium]|nr:flagellar protein FlgN [Clostridiales bacterium]